MATFVIVHGAWDGGWYWQDMANRLRQKGHTVYTPTLTGLGERRHLGTPATDLETHIQDIVNVITYEDLKNVVLVGHSYGGAVVTGVAGQIAERLAEVIYLDAFVLQHNESVGDYFSGTPILDTITAMATQVGDGWLIPAMTGENADPRYTGQPIQTFYQKLNLVNPDAWAALKKSYIKCTAREDKPLYAAFDTCAAFAQSQNWPFYELESGHNPNETAPEALTELFITILKQK